MSLHNSIKHIHPEWTETKSIILSNISIYGLTVVDCRISSLEWIISCLKTANVSAKHQNESRHKCDHQKMVRLKTFLFQSSSCVSVIQEYGKGTTDTLQYTTIECDNEIQSFVLLVVIK